MQKTINIGGKDVNFKFTLAAFYIFKNQFGYDAMTKIVPTLGELLNNVSFQAIAANNGNMAMAMDMLIGSLENVYSFEITDLLNLLWSFAKAADKDIADPIIWYGEFDEFPVYDVLQEIASPLLEALGSKKKLTNTQTMKKESKKQETSKTEK